MTKNKHEHGVASNTSKTFSTFIGCTVAGILKDTFPLGRRDLANGTKTLVFECGWGLTVADNGSHWTESPQDIQRAVDRLKEELSENRKEMKAILELAGIGS